MSRDSKEYADITNALTRFVASNYVPLAVVDNADFKAFVASLNPAYPVPCRQSLRRQLLDASSVAQEDLKSKIGNLATDATVALTMDLWSNRQLLSFLGMTLHVVEDGRLSTHLLCFRRFPGRHTAENITDAYEQVVAEFGLQGRVSMVVTDSAANMLKAFRIAFAVPDEEEHDVEMEDEDDELQAVRLEEVEGLEAEGPAATLLPRRVACAAHTLQLVVRDGLKVCGSAHGSIAKSLTRLNTFIGATRRSTLGMEILNKARTSLAAPNATRWNSQLKAVSSFLRLPDGVVEELRQVELLRPKCPSGGDRMILKEVAATLEPFRIATDLLQGDRLVTASHVVPAVMGLRRSLVDGPAPSTTAVRQLREALLGSLEKRFGDVVNDALYLSATVLDPRFKLLPWTGTSGTEKAKEVQEACLQHLEDGFERRPLAAGDVAQPRSSPSADSGTSSGAVVEVVDLDSPDEDEPQAQPDINASESPREGWGTGMSLYSFMDRQPSAIEAPRSTVAGELEAYLREPALPQGADVLRHWAARAATYPHLEVAARNILAVPASSGPSERVFSMTGRMYSPSRSRLRGDVAEALMRVRCWER